MIPLHEIADISYGDQLDLNKMDRLPASKGGVAFIGRSSENHGVSATVALLSGLDPHEAGLITVALGGTKLLASFVQEQPFYTAQNVVILKPKTQMTFADKLYLCLAIRHNRFRYSAFGREANRTLKHLLVPEPSEFPSWGDGCGDSIEDLSYPVIVAIPEPLKTGDWEPFELQELFKIERGHGPRKKDLTGQGKTPVVTSTYANNGWTGFTTTAPCHPGNTIGVNRNGSVGQAFYQPVGFCSTEDVHIFHPKFKMNPFIALFLTTLIQREQYRFGYGRKWGIERMKQTQIRLPVGNNGDPDWICMEQYTKTLPFSSQIEK